MKDEQPKYPFNVKCIDNTNAEDALVLNRLYTATGGSANDYYYLKETTWSFKKSRFEIVKEDVVKNILGPQTYIPDPEEEKLYEQIARNKYMRQVKPGVWVDVYDVLRAWNVVDPCLQHLLKKALASGQRGHKDLKEDLEDILASAKRAVEMHEEWSKHFKNDF